MRPESPLRTFDLSSKKNTKSQIYYFLPVGTLGVDNIAGEEPILGLVCQRDGENAAIIPSHFDELETDNQVLLEGDRFLVVHRCCCCEGSEHSELNVRNWGVACSRSAGCRPRSRL